MYIYDIYIRTTPIFFFFFFNDTATTEIYTLSLHDALPISRVRSKSTRPSKRNPAAATRLAGVPQFRRVSRQPRRFKILIRVQSLPESAPTWSGRSLGF